MVGSGTEGAWARGCLPLKGGLSYLSHRALFYILCCSRLSSIVIARRQLTKFTRSTNLGDRAKALVFRNKTLERFKQVVRTVLTRGR